MAPVVKLDAGLARKSAALTISSGLPGRPIALGVLSRALRASQALEMSVRNGPGDKVLTRTFGAVLGGKRAGHRVERRPSRSRKGSRWAEAGGPPTRTR